MQTLKVVIIGECGVGKTSLRNQYSTSRFNPSYRATVGLDFHSTNLTLPPYPSCILQLWDTAGQDRFAPLTRAFFRGADAVLLVFDCTRPATLRALRKWWGEFSSVEGVDEGCVVVAVGNKTDLRREGEGVGREGAREVLREIMPERFEEARRGRTRRRGAPKALLLGGTTHLPALTSLLPVLAPQPSPLPSPPRQTPTRQTSSPIATPSLSQTHLLPATRSSSQNPPLVGTMTSIATHPTMYHTPSSSLFMEPGRVGTPTPPATPPRRNRLASAGSQESAISERTVTPPRGRGSEGLTDDGGMEVGSEEAVEEEAAEQHEEEEEEEDNDEPAVFFTSSMDRTSVVPVFEHVARKVLRLREEEERRRASGGSASESTRVGSEREGVKVRKGSWIVLGESRGGKAGCCT